MTGPDLFAVPLPFVTALAALAILLGMTRAGLGTRASRLAFAALLAGVALQAVLVGLRFGYGVERFTAIKSVAPLFTAPLTCLGFRLAADPQAAWRRSLVHLAAGFGLVLFCFAAPFLTDLVIGCNFVFYILLSTRLFVRGAPAFEAVALVSDAVNRARGCNVSQFVNDRRVRDAAARLSESDVPLAELMPEVGFRSRSNFYRAFARVFSMTPAEYRRRVAAQPASQSASSGVVDSTTSANPSAGGSRRST